MYGSNSTSERAPSPAAPGLTRPNMPTLQDVLAAKAVIREFMPPTPMYHYPALDDLTGAETWVKHENHTPIGAFKLRGGLFFMQRLLRNEKVSGVVTASTGNHGQSIAYAAQALGVSATIVVPANANMIKVDAMRQLGAKVLFHGSSFDEAKQFGQEWAAAQGMKFVSSGDEPDLIAGVATYTLEILEQKPNLDYLFVPLGGGSGAAGACLVAQALNPQLRVVAVQSRQAPAACLTWQAREWTTAPTHTFAEGLATSEPFMLPQQILWQHLSHFELVDDDAILDAMAHCFRATKNLVEPAGAASLAGALQMPADIRGTRCALVLSGGNIAVEHMRLCLDRLSLGPSDPDSTDDTP